MTFAVSASQLNDAFAAGQKVLLDGTVDNIRNIVNAALKKAVADLPDGNRSNTMGYIRIPVVAVKFKGTYAGDMIDRALAIVINQLNDSGFRATFESDPDEWGRWDIMIHMG